MTIAKDFITIVSGLPRSGMSMMMRMLQAGGMPVVTDNLRPADADNPNGYYEFEPVKHLSRDASWLRDAQHHHTHGRLIAGPSIEARTRGRPHID